MQLSFLLRVNILVVKYSMVYYMYFLSCHKLNLKAWTLSYIGNFLTSACFAWYSVSAHNIQTIAWASAYFSCPLNMIVNRFTFWVWCCTLYVGTWEHSLLYTSLTNTEAFYWNFWLISHWFNNDLMDIWQDGKLPEESIHDLAHDLVRALQ